VRAKEVPMQLYPDWSETQRLAVITTFSATILQILSSRPALGEADLLLPCAEYIYYVSQWPAEVLEINRDFFVKALERCEQEA
jgi:hypothetical protein